MQRPKGRKMTKKNCLLMLNMALPKRFRRLVKCYLKQLSVAWDELIVSMWFFGHLYRTYLLLEVIFPTPSLLLMSGKQPVWWHGRQHAWPDCRLEWRGEIGEPTCDRVWQSTGLLALFPLCWCMAWLLPSNFLEKEVIAVSNLSWRSGLKGRDINRLLITKALGPRSC